MKIFIVSILITISAVILYAVINVPSSVSGINTKGTTLVVNQSSSQTRELHHLIEKTLEKDTNALSELINFNCGGGSGCYDLGYFITQIIYQMGEDEFITMLSELSSIDKMSLRGFIEVGLEYGYGYSNSNNLGMETALPDVSAYLQN